MQMKQPVSVHCCLWVVMTGTYNTNDEQTDETWQMSNISVAFYSDDSSQEELMNAMGRGEWS